MQPIWQVLVHSSAMPLTCYACNQEATTVEHAPPRCIFPEKKDLPPGVDLRKNLITVPSCEAHNTIRSGDDEYLLYVLPASLGSNETGLHQHLTKVKRAIERRPLLGTALRREAKEIIVHDTETDTWFKAAATPLDVARIDGVLAMNARAIYFHHYGVRFDGELKVYKNFLLSLVHPDLNECTEEMFKMSDQLFAFQTPMGSNPEVFTYRFERDGNTELLELVFYGKNKVLIVLTHAALAEGA